MDWNVIGDIAETLGATGGGLFFLWGCFAWWARRSFVTNKQFNDYMESNSQNREEQNSRLARIENTLQYQPTTKDMNTVTDRLGHVSNDVGKITTNIEWINKTLVSIDQRINK